jgi:pimeloyl-ACP methyl ester carboxylesterase
VIEYPWQAGGTLTRVLEAGTEGIPTVLLHGVGARADRWRENARRLADAGLHVHAIDLPGHGFAAKGDGFDDYSVPGYAAFLRAFLDSIEAERAVLIGTSLGGHVAAQLACEQPGRVAALVLVGALGLVPLGAQARERVAASLADTSEGGVREKLRRVIHDPGLITDEWVAEEARINSSPGAAASFAALAEYFRERIDDDVVGARLTGLDAPPETLLVWGAEDVIVAPSIGERAQELLGRRVALRRIAATGHAPYLESPAEFDDIVLAFLRRSGVLTVGELVQTADHKED